MLVELEAELVLPPFPPPPLLVVLLNKTPVPGTVVWPNARGSKACNRLKVTALTRRRRFVRTVMVMGGSPLMFASAEVVGRQNQSSPTTTRDRGVGCQVLNF